MTNYEDFASLATWFQNGQQATQEPEPLAAYIEQAIEANEAPKAVETAQEAPADATGDRTNPVGAAGRSADPLENIKRVIGGVKDYGTNQFLDPNHAEDD